MVRQRTLPLHFKRHHRVFWLWLPILILSLIGLQKVQATSNNVSNSHVASSAEHRPLLHADNPAPADTLTLSAESAILVDQDTGKILYAKDAHRALPPASIIKLMTALVALNSGNQNRLLTVPHAAAIIEPNIMGLKEGERVSVRDLVHGMLMISANDAAETLAAGSYSSRAEFIGRMNRAAQQLGLTETRFANPTGLDNPDTHSSAYDMATIATYALKTHPELKEMWNTHDLTIPATVTHGPYYLYNISDLIDIYPGIDGVKTGYTDEAGHTLVASASRGPKHMLLVYMNAITSIQDAEALFDYGFSR